jgi:2-dehydro-3-deoxyglucarate aldolase
MKINRIRTLLAEGRACIGGWATIGHPTVTEIMGMMGFDWVLIDCEHGPLSFETAQLLLQGLNGSEATPFVRVADSDPATIKRALDIGAMGIVVPLVNDRETAERVVRAVKYPPQGIRGIGLPRANQYGMGFEKYMAQANDEIMTIAQIEHADAVENLDEIAAVPGIDMLFVGPVDLAGSYGRVMVNGELPAEVKRAIDKIIATAKRAGIPLGCWAPNVGTANQRIEQGFQFIGVGTDNMLLISACQTILRGINRTNG